MSARSSARALRARERSWPSIASRSTSPPICRCWARPGAVRAGALQPPRQRRQIRAAGYDDPAAGWRDGGSVHLQILDEGDGIPPEDLERIFDKFYRAQKGDQVRAGTGLGLAISRGFIEAMGGTIIAANRTDRTGAVFTMTLPIPRAGRALDTAA